MTLPKPKLPLSGLFSLAMALLIASPLTVAHAGTAGIQDHAAFFSESAKADATANIRNLQKSTNKDICIETFTSIPVDKTRGIDPQDKAAFARIYET
jgi:hypothetical protein